VRPPRDESRELQKPGFHRHHHASRIQELDNSSGRAAKVVLGKLRSLVWPTSELSVSGLMNQGVPSRPRSRLGSEAGSKNTASPKSAGTRISSSLVSNSLQESPWVGVGGGGWGEGGNKLLLAQCAAIHHIQESKMWPYLLDQPKREGRAAASLQCSRFCGTGRMQRVSSGVTKHCQPPRRYGNSALGRDE